MRSAQETAELLKALGVDCKVGDEVYDIMSQTNPTVKAYMAGEITMSEAIFVEAYLSNGFNASRAAETAKYQGLKSGCIAQVGKQVLRRPKIRDLVARRISDAALNADEVLAEWAEIAKADMNDFVTVQQVQHPLSDDLVNVAVPDMAKAADRGKIHLVKKVKMDINGNFTLELRDQDNALNQIARHLGMFEKDNVLNIPKGLADLLAASPEERQKALSRYKEKLEEDL
jgi:hypothetical protein